MESNDLGEPRLQRFLYVSLHHKVFANGEG